MITSIRPRRLGTGLAAVLLGGMALAAVIPAVAMDAAAVQEHRDRERPANAAPARPQPQQASPAQPQAQPQQGRGPSPQVQRGPQPRYDNNGYRGGNNNGRPPVVIGPPRGRQGPDARVMSPGQAYGYGRPAYNNRPPRVVQTLPSGYYSYRWNGSPYYRYGGSWYRPYGGSYVVVGAPYGLFVSSLPSYYSTTWVGGNRYFYADDTYYAYEPSRRGYVVTRSPYNDSDEDSDEGGAPAQRDEDVYIYPMKGQSEQQQADDRYECHRWAADQVQYDPTSADYNAESRSKYDRANTACLTGRGYSVK